MHILPDPRHGSQDSVTAGISDEANDPNIDLEANPRPREELPQGFQSSDSDGGDKSASDPLDPTGSLKMAYYYLMDCTVQQLRDVQRTWSESFQKVTQATKKFDFVANLMQLVKTELSNGRKLEDLFVVKMMSGTSWDSLANGRRDVTWRGGPSGTVSSR